MKLLWHPQHFIWDPMYLAWRLRLTELTLTTYHQFHEQEQNLRSDDITDKISPLLWVLSGKYFILWETTLLESVHLRWLPVVIVVLNSVRLSAIFSTTCILKQPRGTQKRSKILFRTRDRLTVGLHALLTFYEIFWQPAFSISAWGFFLVASGQL